MHTKDSFRLFVLTTNNKRNLSNMVRGEMSAAPTVASVEKEEAKDPIGYFFVGIFGSLSPKYDAKA